MAAGEAVSIAIMAVIILLECRTGALTARRNSEGPQRRVAVYHSVNIPQGDERPSTVGSEWKDNDDRKNTH